MSLHSKISALYYGRGRYGEIALLCDRLIAIKIILPRADNFNEEYEFGFNGQMKIEIVRDAWFGS